MTPPPTIKRGRESMDRDTCDVLGGFASHIVLPQAFSKQRISNGSSSRRITKKRNTKVKIECFLFERSCVVKQENFTGVG